jgi:hypothetical protein
MCSVPLVKRRICAWSLFRARDNPAPFTARSANTSLRFSDGVYEVLYRLTVLPGNLADLIDREP